MSKSIDMKHVRQAAALIREKIDEAARLSSDPKVVDRVRLHEVVWKVQHQRDNGGLCNLDVALNDVVSEREMAGIDQSRGAYEKAIGRMLGRVSNGAKRDGQAASVSWEEADRLDDRSKGLVLLANELALRNGR
jgi:hypothetical protein